MRHVAHGFVCSFLWFKSFERCQEGRGGMAAMGKLAWCSFLLLPFASANFVPFADVEEVKPHRLHEHCEEAADEEGHRWCSRSFKKRLEDGSDIELNWRMHINPDRILSLDTEAEHGVKVTRCSPDELDLFVPHTHLGHLEAGKFIVGSHFVHNCPHLPESAMYHKILQVQRKRTSDGGVGKMFHYQLATEAVPHMGYTAKHVNFYFNYMPVEAREDDYWPKRRSYLDLPREQRQQQRRLFNFPGFVQPNAGDFHTQGQTSADMQRTNGIVSFNPDQLSNFGWNWNFFLNETKAPRFVIDQPDTHGTFILENPYVKAHAGCFLNFTSRFEGFMHAPHIIWQAGLNGKGIMQGRLRGALNSTRSMEMEASSYKIPSTVLENFPFLRILTKFEETRWFSPIHYAAGPMPVSFTPGFQFQMEVYHKGPFSGFLATGGSTRGTLRPVLHFDSEKGFMQTLQGELLNTTVYPPLYLIFTKAFEFGIRADPIMHLKGDFMGFQNVEAALHFRVYQNVSVYRQGQVHFGVDQRKELVLFPFRVVGLSELDFNTKYKLQIKAKGVEKTSAPTISWGDVEFHEDVSNFNFGNCTDAEAADLKIVLTLYKEVGGVATQLGTGEYTVMSWEKGIAQPVPTWVNIVSASNEPVANAQLYIVHKVDPVPFLASRIKGIGFSFPSMYLMPEQISNENPGLDDSCPLKIHLILGNRSYLVDISGSVKTPAATGKTVIELYPSFVDMWAQCAPSMQFCTSPQMELWCGGTLLGSGPVPPFGIPVPEEPNFLEKMIGIQVTTAPPVGPAKTTMLPQVTLTTPENVAVATVTSEVRMSPATGSSEFLSPSFGQTVTLGQGIQFIWTVAGCTPGQVLSFSVIPMMIESKEEVMGQDLSHYRRIGDQYLVPDAGSTQSDVSGTCESRSVLSVPAEQLPCSFAKELAFNGPAFEETDKLIVMVTWMKDGMQHKIYSPPFVLSAGRRLRQLQAGPVALPPATADPMAPQSAQLSATPPAPNAAPKAADPDAVPQPGAMGSEECKRQDLRFNFGQGAEARVEVLSMGVPEALQQDMPMYDEPDSGAPVFASPWQAMGGNQPAMEAKDFLPDGACEMGMCDTMLPGCREAQFKSLYFPRLVFNFSRPMYYDNSTNNSQTTKLIKEAMAWAFSAMPEAIQVALQELEQREKELKQQTAVPNYGFGNYGQPNQQNQYGFNAGQQNNWFNQQQSGGSTQQMPQAFGKWWNTQRRLTARMGVDSDGNPAEMRSKLMSHQAEIRFQHGLPYRITHDVVRKMIKQGMLPVDDGKSKELGDLNIIGFYLDEDLDDEIPTVASPPAGWAVAALAASAAVAALLSAVAVVVLRSRWHTATGYEVPLQAKEPEQVEVGLE